MLEYLHTSVASGEPILVMIAAGLAALLLFWGIASALGRAFDPARRRLQEIAGGGVQASSIVGQQFAGVLRPIERFVLPQGAERGGTRQRLRFAGFRSSSAVSTFYSVKLALAAALALGWLLITHFLPPLGGSRVVFFALVACFFGT